MAVRYVGTVQGAGVGLGGPRDSGNYIRMYAGPVSNCNHCLCIGWVGFLVRSLVNPFSVFSSAVKTEIRNKNRRSVVRDIIYVEVEEDEEVVVVEEEEDCIVSEGTASESHSSHSLASLLPLLDEPSMTASPSLRCSNSGRQ